MDRLCNLEWWTTIILAGTLTHDFATKSSRCLTYLLPVGTAQMRAASMATQELIEGASAIVRAATKRRRSWRNSYGSLVPSKARDCVLNYGGAGGRRPRERVYGEAVRQARSFCGNAPGLRPRVDGPSIRPRLAPRPSWWAFCSASTTRCTTCPWCARR
jgi:hypothetical protein